MNILTYDIEEWFHILDHEATKSEKQWNDFECRIHQNMDRIFAQLERNKVKATFFCVGWIAEKYPEVVKEIVEKGYEIGSHTRMHQLAYTQNPQEFKSDVEHSIKTLQDLSGKKVKYFRAPGFSITEKNKWAFEILVDLGIEIDSSIFPAPRAHGGYPNFGPCGPAIIKYNGIELKELPINYYKKFKSPIIFSGGGYFRLFPYRVIKRWTRKSNYVMAYFHPRDFDSAQPNIAGLSRVRRFKSSVGLKKTEQKLDQWLRDFDFMDIKTAHGQINWKNLPIVEL
ncbi:MAG TPA: polysaccharide deacetylase family protein [Aequorivita sp.]|nr:polysaccharide deacetylase family protein [Aequorivita sp.]